MKNAEKEYWQIVDANPFRDSYLKTRFLNITVDNLVEYGRHYIEIRCLRLMLHDNKEIDAAQCVCVLLTAVSSSEPHNLFGPYHAT